VDTTPVFHVAFVVEDIEEASAAWGRAIGVRFGKLQTPSLVWGTPEGKRELVCKFVYSINGPPYIELVERRDDSFWEEVGFHHLGVWSNDVAVDSERLTSIGAEWSCAVLDTAGVRTGGCILVLNLRTMLRSGQGGAGPRRSTS
jgi:hypothetical protein